METLQIIQSPTNNREHLNLGEFAEEATIMVEDTAKEQKANHFIESNTKEVDLQHLRQDCIVPVFAKDNELTISHAAFVETVWEAANSFFNGESIDKPDIRCSHVIKGRTPEAIHKPVSQLLESDKTIYYERMAFSFEIPTIYETVGGNRLNLCITGVRAYNRENLFSKKTTEKFSIAIGFRNVVCCNLCTFTDGYRASIEVTNTNDLFRKVLELLHTFNPALHIHLLKALENNFLSEKQFTMLLGKARLYQCLPPSHQKRLPRLLLTDTQINAVAKAYISDENFGGFGNELSMWKFYNLLTGANKSSYIDSLLERSLNATELATGINASLKGENDIYRWFIE
jgi:hypothetical protein